MPQASFHTLRALRASAERSASGCKAWHFRLRSGDMVQEAVDGFRTCDLPPGHVRGKGAMSNGSELLTRIGVEELTTSRL